MRHFISIESSCLFFLSLHKAFQWLQVVIMSAVTGQNFGSQSVTMLIRSCETRANGIIRSTILQQRRLWLFFLHMGR